MNSSFSGCLASAFPPEMNEWERRPSGELAPRTPVWAMAEGTWQWSMAEGSGSRGPGFTPDRSLNMCASLQQLRTHPRGLVCGLKERCRGNALQGPEMQWVLPDRRSCITLPMTFCFVLESGPTGFPMKPPRTFSRFPSGNSCF